MAHVEGDVEKGTLMDPGNGHFKTEREVKVLGLGLRV